MINLNKKYLLLLFALFAIKANAQIISTPIGVMNTDDMDSLSNKHRRFAPSIYLGTDLYPDRKLYSGYYPQHNGPGGRGFDDDRQNLSDSSIHYTHYEFSITAPIKRWMTDEGTHQINLYASGSWDKFSLSWFQSKHDLFTGSAGFQYLYYQPKENLFLTHFSVGFANDQNYFNQEIGLRYSGLVLFNRLKNPKFQYFVGLATTYAYGDAQWIPLVGGKIKITHKDFLRISFPLSKHYEFYPIRLAYYHPLSRRTMLFGEWEKQGSSFRIYSGDELISSQTASVQLRIIGASLGVGFRYLLNSNIRLQFELNDYYGGNQQIAFYNNLDINAPKISGYNIQSGLLMQGSVMWNFNSHSKNTASPRVDFLDIQNIEVEDLPDDYK